MKLARREKWSWHVGRTVLDFLMHYRKTNFVAMKTSFRYLLDEVILKKAI